MQEIMFICNGLCLQKKPDDYIISFDKKYSIRDFILQSGRFLGLDIGFKGKGMNETGYIKNITKNSLNIYTKIKVGKTVIRVNKNISDLMRLICFLVTHLKQERI